MEDQDRSSSAAGVRNDARAPVYDMVPYARVNRYGLRPDDLSFYREEALGFSPTHFEEDWDGSAPCSYVYGTGWRVGHDATAADLAATYMRCAQPLFHERNVRVLIRTRQASRMSARLREVLACCGAREDERSMRTCDRVELVVVPRGVGGSVAPAPFLFAATIIITVQELLESWTLTGEERAAGVLAGCESYVAAESPPEGFRRQRMNCIVGLGIEWRF